MSLTNNTTEWNPQKNITGKKCLVEGKRQSVSRNRGAIIFNMALDLQNHPLEHTV